VYIIGAFGILNIHLLYFYLFANGVAEKRLSMCRRALHIAKKKVVPWRLFFAALQ
jgi:hypothetical protein